MNTDEHGFSNGFIKRKATLLPFYLCLSVSIRGSSMREAARMRQRFIHQSQMDNAILCPFCGS